MLRRDDFGRLHCEDGPAVAYPDGWEVYAVGGVRVPKAVVMEPERLSVQEIKKEGNAEVRRVMVERFGPDRYFLESGAKLIDSDFVKVATNDARQMPRMLVEDSDGQRWFVGTDGSTHRTYHLPAPRVAKTCREAHHAMCGLDESKCVAQS